MNRIALLAAAMLTVTAEMPAAAQDTSAPALPAGPHRPIEPGEYRDRSSSEMFHGLRLNADGTYQWALSVGALDRRSAGTWVQQDGVVTLTTKPVPVAPQFRRDPDDSAAEAPFVIVRWPDGTGIAGIDFVLTCAHGESFEDYTQADGWELERGACKTPVAIALTEPIHTVGPAQFDISGSTGGLRFTLVPNDFGVTDMTGTKLTASGAAITFEVMGHQVTMDRVTPD